SHGRRPCLESHKASHSVTIENTFLPRLSRPVGRGRPITKQTSSNWYQDLYVRYRYRQLITGEDIKIGYPSVEVTRHCKRTTVGWKESEQILSRGKKKFHTGVATVSLSRLVEGDDNVVGEEAREHQIVTAEPAKTHPLAPWSIERWQLRSSDGNLLKRAITR
ncbi:MAG: hypothetical protein ACLP7Q_05535, partial [Isosphaeraceae bacterium]